MGPKKVNRNQNAESDTIIGKHEADDEDYFGRLFSSISDQYSRQIYCDAILYAPDDSNNLEELKSLKCHSLVLCSVVPGLKELLLQTEDGESHLIFPDLTFSEVQTFIERIYDGINGQELTLEMSQDVYSVLFGFTKSEETTANNNTENAKEKMVEIVVENHEAIDGMQQFELIIPETDNLNFTPIKIDDTYETSSKSYYRDKLEYYQEDIGKSKEKRTYAKSGRKRAAAGEAWGPVAKILPPQKKMYFDHGSWVIQPHNVPGKELPKTMEDVKNVLLSNQGWFSSSTNSYYTVARVTNEKGLNLLSKDGNERQFRMKLPETTLCAFLAVGYREGRNIAQTLALKEANASDSFWKEEMTFGNLIEATKKIGGLSFGDILKHPRCAGSKEHFSKMAVNQVKETLKELSAEEREKQLVEAVTKLKDFDEKEESLEFHHIPAKRTSMEFNLTDQMEFFEIQDYCILHGNSLEDLTIQSFFNFGVQKFTRLRLVTTMCDTLACFLGLNNLTPLADYHLMKECYEDYSDQTIRTIALQDLQTGTIGRSKCKDLIEVTDANYIQASEEIVTDVVLVDGKIVTTMPSMTKTIHIPPAKRGPKKKPAKELPCPHCKKIFGKELLLQGHIERMHSSISQSEKTCTVCNKTLKGSQTLRDHVYYYHTPKVCDPCNIEFPGAYEYYYHRNKQHSNPLYCDICSGEFKSKEKLRVHKINKHLNDNEKPYVCSICGKGYAHKTKLESHQMNVHIRARPYKCRVENCDADFNELANRNAHEKNVHQYNYKKTMELANSSMTVLDDVKIIIAKDSEDITIKNLKHSEEA